MTNIYKPLGILIQSQSQRLVKIFKNTFDSNCVCSVQTGVHTHYMFEVHVEGRTMWRNP